MTELERDDGEEEVEQEECTDVFMSTPIDILERKKGNVRCFGPNRQQRVQSRF